MEYKEFKETIEGGILDRLGCLDEFEGDLAEYELMRGRRYEFSCHQGRPLRGPKLNKLTDTFHPAGDFYYKFQGASSERKLGTLQISRELLVELLKDCEALIHVRRLVVFDPDHPNDKETYVSGVPVRRKK